MNRHQRQVRQSCFAAAIAVTVLNGTAALAQDVSAPAMIQFFESTSLNTSKRTADLFMAGYGQIWLPPASRADSGNQSVGYDVYDRFDLGNADNPTLYGTERTFKRATTELRRAGITSYADLVWNHNGFSVYENSFFANSGGYPGFRPNEFHNINIDVNNDQYNGRTSGLIDIDHYVQQSYVRNPVPGAANNLPAGTSPQFGRLANVATESNRRFYQDRNRPADRIVNGNQVWDFTADTATTGDPVAETAVGYLMRNAQWMVQVMGVDGFRLDATKHMPVDVLNTYFDAAVFGANRRQNLDGSYKSVFSFGENFDTNKSYLQTYVRKDGFGNRDTKDFPLYYALQQNLTGNGQSNSWYNVVSASFDSQDDGIANNGSQGIGFVQSADSFGPELSNVAYAYSLMRPGNQLVYFNAKGVGDGRDFPKDGRGDALGGLYGDTITKLVGLRNTHGRGNYIERWIEKETLIYERDKSAIVGLSNRVDNGFDTRTINTNFASGTRLVEMTGNATDPSVDPNNNIADFVVVGANGQVTISVPRNINSNGGRHDKGYVVYGLPTPRGTLSIPDRATTIAGGTPSANTNGTTRLAALEAVTGNTFTIALDTIPVVIGGFTDTFAGGDNAVFSINGGFKPDGTPNDLNGVGGVDYSNPSLAVVYGFEEFKGKKSPLVGGGDGQFRQTIDTTKLVEGFNYLEVRAFRSRPANEPAVYSSFKKVIYVDRLPAVSELTEVRNVGGNDRAVRITNADQTADNVHAFLDLGSALTDAQVLALVSGGSNASQIDADLWSKSFSNVGSGNHNLTLVTYEPSGRSVVRRYTGIAIQTGRGLGLGDVNFDNQYNGDDAIGANSFETVLYTRGTTFNPAADLNADGKVDNLDLFALPGRYVTVGASAGTIANARAAITRRGNVNGDAVTTAADVDFLYTRVGNNSGDLWLYDMNVDGAVTTADVDLLITGMLFTRKGDIDLNRKVEFSDLLSLAQNYGQAANGWASGDFNGNGGTIGFDDLLALAQNYGFGTTGQAASATLIDAGSDQFATDWALAQSLVPEPTTLAAMAAGASMVLRRVRR